MRNFYKKNFHKKIELYSKFASLNFLIECKTIFIYILIIYL